MVIYEKVSFNQLLDVITRYDTHIYKINLSEVSLDI